MYVYQNSPSFDNNKVIDTLSLLYIFLSMGSIYDDSKTFKPRALYCGIRAFLSNIKI